MEPPQVLFISLSFWKWHTLTKGTYARVKAHFSRRQYLLACFLAQHMSDVCVRPLSLLWLVALSMKRYILGMIPDTGNCENDFDKRKLWKRILKDSNTSACQLSVACAVRGIIHTHRPSDSESEWSKVFKSAPQQLNKHVSAPGVDELDCSMRCKNWKDAPKISVIDGKLWSAAASPSSVYHTWSTLCIWKKYCKKGFLKLCHQIKDHSLTFAHIFRLQRYNCLNYKK